MVHLYYVIGTFFLLTASIIFYISIRLKRYANVEFSSVKHASKKIIDIIKEQRDSYVRKFNQNRVDQRVKAKEIRESVFFDKENGTIVTVDNLVKIGKL